MGKYIAIKQVSTRSSDWSIYYEDKDTKIPVLDIRNCANPEGVAKGLIKIMNTDKIILPIGYPGYEEKTK